MSIEEFLDEMSEREMHLLRYQQNRNQFADDCLSAISHCLVKFELRRSPAEPLLGDDARFSARIHRMSAAIYDTLEHFMHHYSKTDRISFQIVPEESWNRENIAVRTFIVPFNEFVGSQRSSAADYASRAKEYAALVMRTKECYKSIHKVLKKKAYEYFPAIIDLPAMGLRELDFILFEETQGLMEAVN